MLAPTMRTLGRAEGVGDGVRDGDILSMSYRVEVDERRDSRRKYELGVEGGKKEDEGNRWIMIMHLYRLLLPSSAFIHRPCDPGVNHAFPYEFVRWLINYDPPSSPPRA